MSLFHTAAEPPATTLSRYSILSPTALSVRPTPDQLEYLVGHVPLDLGFPHNMVVRVFFFRVIVS
jgi:hypothetical protein